jgi:SAM-dependent methyltransferase
LPFFADMDEAARYAASRPFFHPLAIARAGKAIGLQQTVPLALDVACGTGQSTKALAAIADRVIGLDISRSMLAHAQADARIQYLTARAEALPVRSGTASLVTSALAFHWFDRRRFLSEARRVLLEGGYLLIYNNGFTGIMGENPAFQTWSQKDYLQRFPVPPRDSAPLAAQEAERAGFTLLAEDVYENEIRFTADELAAYLTTQTNVKAALDQGRETLATATAWLLGQLRPFFVATNASFVFRTRAWYLQKAAPAPASGG